MKFVADKFNIGLDELKEGINKTAKYYNVQDFSEDDKLSVFVLAKVRIINNDDDSLNLYRNGNYYNVSYNGKTEKILADEQLYPKLFDFFDKNNLKY